MNPETAGLLATLDAQRAHVIGIADGLSDQALRTAVLPTGWTFLGLIQHLTLDVEQFWFRQVAAGEPIEPVASADDPAAAWRVPAEVSADTVFARYRREIELANAIISTTPLDTEPAGWPEEMGPDWRLPDLRTIILHVITETACHAGHLDAARELLDGRTWRILT